MMGAADVWARRQPTGPAFVCLASLLQEAVDAAAREKARLSYVQQQQERQQ